MHCAVCAVVMEVGEAATVTAVIVLHSATVTTAEPDLAGSCPEVAVMVAVPGPPGVKTPELPMVPALAGLRDHETAEL